VHVGDKLKLPKVEPKIATVEPKLSDKAIAYHQDSVQTNKITDSTYTVAKGDNLWDIAVRAYGDGYKWTDIARANNLSNPGSIYSGDTLKLPRGK
jgi:putative chitinase